MRNNDHFISIYVKDNRSCLVLNNESSAVPLGLVVVHNLSLDRARVRSDTVVDRTAQLVSVLLDIELGDEQFLSIGISVVKVAVELSVAVGLGELNLKVAPGTTSAYCKFRLIETSDLAAASFGLGEVLAVRRRR